MVSTFTSIFQTYTAIQTKKYFLQKHLDKYKRAAEHLIRSFTTFFESQNDKSAEKQQKSNTKLEGSKTHQGSKTVPFIEYEWDLKSDNILVIKPVE